jgi:integrase
MKPQARAVEKVDMSILDNITVAPAPTVDRYAGAEIDRYAGIEVDRYQRAAVDRYAIMDRYVTVDRCATAQSCDWAATVEVAKLTGAFVAAAAGRITVGALAVSWLASATRLKATTRAARESAWSHRVAPRWAELPIADVRPSAIKSWVAELSADGVGAASIESALLVLRGVLQSALDDRQLAVNPAANIKAPRRKHERRGYLTHQQVSALAAEVGGEGGTVVGFLAYTGLRWGEMAALRVENFDMLRRRVLIAQAVAEVRGALVWDTPKTHERRSVPFPAFLTEPLAALMVDKRRDDLVFAGRNGVVLRVSTFRPRVFVPAVERCRVGDPLFPTVTPHDLRHTAASLSISAGANVKAVQTMLGHASAAMTLDTYSDLFPDDLDAVAARLDAAARAPRRGRTRAECGFSVGANEGRHLLAELENASDLRKHWSG